MGLRQKTDALTFLLGLSIARRYIVRNIFQTKNGINVNDVGYLFRRVHTLGPKRVNIGGVIPGMYQVNTKHGATHLAN